MSYCKVAGTGRDRPPGIIEIGSGADKVAIGTAGIDCIVDVHTAAGDRKCIQCQSRIDSYSTITHQCQSCVVCLGGSVYRQGRIT